MQTFAALDLRPCLLAYSPQGQLAYSPQAQTEEIDDVTKGELSNARRLYA